MPRSATSGRLLAAALGLFYALPMTTAQPPNLPQPAARRLQEVERRLDRVEELLGGGDAAAAEKELATAQTTFQGLLRTFRIPGEHPALQPVAARLAALAERVKAPGGEPKPAPEETPPPPAAKLPGPVAKRLRDAAAHLDQAERDLAGGKFTTCRNRLDSARGLLEEIRSGYGSQAPPDHPELKAVADRLAAATDRLDKLVAGKEAAGKEAAARCEADSALWLGRLKPFVDSGSPQQLLPGASPRPLFAAASALLAEYQKAEFPAGRTDLLGQVAEQLRYAVETWPKVEAERIERLAREAAEKLRLTEENWVRWIEVWGKGDPTKLPPSMHPDQYRQLEAAVAALADADPAHKELAGLRQRLAAIQAENEKRLEANLKSRVMDPDRYAGKDAAQIKAFAATVIKDKVPKGELLRVALTSAEWQVEDVVEWTDTTRTAWRRRVTRFLWAQAAVREGEQVFLHGVYIGQDRRPDGEWGPHQGHTAWRNRILPENVSK